jgi:hypothetical protein
VILFALVCLLGLVLNARASFHASGFAKKNCAVNSSGQEKTQREAQAKADKITSDLNKKRKQLLQAKKDAAKAKIEAVVPRLDANDIKNAPGTNAHLDLQLDWHRSQNSQAASPKRKT